MRYCHRAVRADVPRKLIEIANAAEPVQDARIYIERVNGPFLAAGGSPAEYRAGIERAIAKGWLWRHESGTYVKFTQQLPAVLNKKRKGEPVRTAVKQRGNLFNPSAIV
jgi:hypothetical protein